MVMCIRIYVVYLSLSPSLDLDLEDALGLISSAASPPSGAVVVGSRAADSGPSSLWLQLTTYLHIRYVRAKVGAIP